MSFLALLLALAAHAGCFDPLEKALDTAAQKGEFSGQMLISREGMPLVWRTAGFADTDAKRRLTSYHRLDIGSIGKHFTAAAILKLVETGKLKLDAKLGEFFPELTAPKADLNVLDLITMRSGLENSWHGSALHESLEQYWDDKDRYYRELAKALKFDPEKRGTWEYNNNGYDLLAHIVDVRAGKSLEQYWRELFFESPSLTDGEIECSPNDDSLDPILRVIGTEGGRNVDARSGDLERDTSQRGGGGVSCSAAGLASWLDALMTNRVFKDEELAKFLYLAGEPDEYKQGEFLYSFGLNVMNDRSLWHNGRREPGFNAFMHFDPASRTCFVLLTNTGNEKLNGELFSLYLRLRGQCSAAP